MTSQVDGTKIRYWKKKRGEAADVQCSCGCGQWMPSIDNYGRPALFLNGHNRRKYAGEDATPWAREKRWRAKNAQKLKDGKRAYYRKRKLLAMELLGNKCSFCPEEYNGKNAPIFEFHHTNPQEKENGITRMLTNKAWADTLIELERCVLVCANCHNQHHGGEW